MTPHQSLSEHQQETAPDARQQQDIAFDFERAAEDVEHHLHGVRDAINLNKQDQLWDELNELRTATDVMGQTVERFMGEVRPAQTREEAPRAGEAQ